MCRALTRAGDAEGVEMAEMDDVVVVVDDMEEEGVARVVLLVSLGASVLGPVSAVAPVTPTLRLTVFFFEGGVGGGGTRNRASERARGVRAAGSVRRLRLDLFPMRFTSRGSSGGGEVRHATTQRTESLKRDDE